MKPGAGEGPVEREVLLVENDEADVILTREALKEAGLRVRLRVTTNPLDALESLLDASRPLPALVLLDLNMPPMNGLEVLHALRAEKRTSRLPVVIVTTSAASADVQRSYALGANAYVTKPANFTRYVQLVSLTFRFWMDAAQLPVLDE